MVAMLPEIPRMVEDAVVPIVVPDKVSIVALVYLSVVPAMVVKLALAPVTVVIDALPPVAVVNKRLEMVPLTILALVMLALP